MPALIRAHPSIAADPLGIAVAFGAGMLSFVSPCVLPLVPGYVSMVSGLSASELRDGQPRDLVRVLWGVLWFVAGFTVVFTALGALASGLGSMLAAHHRELEVASGVLVCLLGLWMVGVARPALAGREWRFHPSVARLGRFAPPVMGMAFAFGWTPCIGPVLGGVLGLASSRSTLGAGVVLLVAYSLGLGVPFLATGLAFGRLTGLLGRLRALRAVDLVAGVALVAFGVLLVSGELHWLSSRVSGVLYDLHLGRFSTG